MSRAVNDLVSRVAYLRRSVDLLISRLEDVDHWGGESLDPLGDSILEDVNTRWANGLADHIQLAIEHAEGWYDKVAEIMASKYNGT